jgi:hypothetical protein
MIAAVATAIFTKLGWADLAAATVLLWVAVVVAVLFPSPPNAAL